MKNESNYSVLLHFCNAYKTIFSKYRTYRILHYVIIIDGTANLLKNKNEILDVLDVYIHLTNNTYSFIPMLYYSLQ